jgi:DNA-binding NarL/FixJ family response regulator
MRIAIADNNFQQINVLSRFIQKSMLSIDIIWSATDGADVLERCKYERPDLLLVGLSLGGMNSIDVIRNVMLNSPGQLM